MKYEAVFGNQELFDGAGTFTGLDVVVHSIASGIKSYARLSDLTPESLRNYPVCAMRRIIAEPKRWTVTDKKAGKLPDVGCKVFDVMNENKVIVKAINTRQVCLESPDGFIYLLPPDDIKPIESPEEKSARLREEWCAKAAKTLKNLEYNSTLTSIYDALLSSELPMPSKGGE